MKYLMIAAGLAAATTGFALTATPAHATGKMKCDVKAEDRKPMDALEAKLVEEGWQVRKVKLDGGCYEVYGTTPDGDRVEAYFDPANFEKLLVSRRGEILFRKEGR
ncbi:PepSY domain-containing protein [Sphingomicrobium sediminis]|uniref:PepSY domain-containing protein n=1 Tax=Sphingomicrobium sediminis TaxID=2950949 RepID=A0A9X2ELD5_9SPHN|nr:PepSY domain-containing protein [Sphingomicrobium sediminis]MCM8557599.1 PepSY domain-containing protein [Sphingomicrobium sediminis]